MKARSFGERRGVLQDQRGLPAASGTPRAKGGHSPAERLFLAKHCVTQLGPECTRRLRGSAIETFMDYSWPWNIRELEKCCCKKTWALLNDEDLALSELIRKVACDCSHPATVSRWTDSGREGGLRSAQASRRARNVN